MLRVISAWLVESNQIVASAVILEGGSQHVVSRHEGSPLMTVTTGLEYQLMCDDIMFLLAFKALFVGDGHMSPVNVCAINLTCFDRDFLFQR